MSQTKRPAAYYRASRWLRGPYAMKKFGKASFFVLKQLDMEARAYIDQKSFEQIVSGLIKVNGLSYDIWSPSGYK